MVIGLNTINNNTVSISNKLLGEMIKDYITINDSTLIITTA